MTTTLRPATRFAVRLDPDHLTDGQLLGRYVGERDEVAFAVLVRRHAGLVYGVCRRALGNAADADDAFQAAFVVLIRKADALAGRATVGDWLYAVAVRVARKARTAAARRARREAVVAGRRSEAVPPDTSGSLDWFDRELASLPERYREPVVLCLIQERSREDAAAALGIPEGTLASRLAYARKRLADRLTRRGVTAPTTLAAVAPAALLDTTAAFGCGAVVPERLTHLMNGATQTMLFTKVRIGLMAGAAMLLAGGVLLAAPGANSADRNARRNAPVPEKKEPEWMTKFTAAYQLKDGELVKRVAPPFIPERDEYLYGVWYKEQQTPEAEEKARADLADGRLFFVLLMESDGKQLTRRTCVSVNPLRSAAKLRNGDNTMTVWDAVTWVTGRDAPEVAIDPNSKGDPLFSKEERQAPGATFTGWPTVSGDFVTRKGAPLDKLAPQLEKILREECGVDVRLTVKEEEQEVYVVGGKFALTPRGWRTKDEIDVYADEAVLDKEYDKSASGRAGSDDVSSGWYTHTPTTLMRHLGEFTNARIVWDTELPASPRFNVYLHQRWPHKATAEQKAADRDPAKVLKTVSEQTGLTFKKEKRKVPVLVVSVPEKK